MKRCPTCNRTYSDETLSFCLSDGALLSASGDPQATQNLPASENEHETLRIPASQVPQAAQTSSMLHGRERVMSITGDKFNQPNEADKTRRTIFIIAGVIAIVLIAGLIYYLKTRPETQTTAGPVDEKLEGGLRAGSPDFDKYRDLIKVDEPVADYSNSLAGGIQMNLATTVRNFTGRTINGLEMKGSVVDLNGKVIRERTRIVIPSGEMTEIENNQTARVPITIPGFNKEDEKAKIEGGQAKLKMEVTAVKFK